MKTKEGNLAVSPRRRLSLFGVGVCLGLLTFAHAAGNPDPEAAQDQKASPAKVTANTLPIGLDTVLRLAENQNPQIALARARLDDANAECDLAATKWLPDLYVGPAYYRHEGIIQNEDGTVLRSTSFGSMFAGLDLHGRLDLKEYAYQKAQAQRKIWQQEGDLSKVTSETLLDAAGTYFDWLAARSGEAIAREQTQYIDKLLEDAKRLAALEGPARIEVVRLEADLAGRRESLAKQRSQAAAAAAKLIYLLGLDPAAELQPLDRRLIPFELVNADRPVSELVSQALAQGPGIREMEGLLAFIQENADRANGPGRFVPVFEIFLNEGGFGGGPGDSMTWNNRLDLGLQARWNLTNLFTRRQRQRALDTKIEQAHLTYKDLQGKLTLGVQEARETIVGGKEQIRQAQEHIDKARSAYELSNERLKEHVPGSTHSEVLLSLQGLGMAQANYLNVLREYNKAQVRLMVLLGGGAKKEDRR